MPTLPSSRFSQHPQEPILQSWSKRNLETYSNYQLYQGKIWHFELQSDEAKENSKQVAPEVQQDCVFGCSANAEM